MHPDTNAARVWRLATPGNLLWQAWEDEEYAVLYSSFSGDTHLVQVLTKILLEHLGSTPRTEDAIIQSLTSAFPDEPHDDIRQFVAESLLELQGIGIVACHTV